MWCNAAQHIISRLGESGFDNLIIFYTAKSKNVPGGKPTIGFSCNLLQVGLPTGMSSAELSGAATTDDESVTSGQVIFNILLTKSFNLTHLSTPLFLSQAASQRGCVPIY